MSEKCLCFSEDKAIKYSIFREEETRTKLSYSFHTETTFTKGLRKFFIYEHQAVTFMAAEICITIM
jgi:hypothetical protein